MIYDSYLEIETKIKNFLNSTQADKLFKGSPRTVGDRIEEVIKNQIDGFIGNIINFDPRFARRAMEDLAFEDVEGNYYALDVKTHNLQTVFNMPNLTSVQRLAKFYQDANNYFCLLKIDYAQGLKSLVKAVHFYPSNIWIGIASLWAL